VGTKREYADDPFGKWRVRVFSHIYVFEQRSNDEAEVREEVLLPHLARIRLDPFGYFTLSIHLPDCTYHTIQCCLSSFDN
jgi:hypothetical protein